MLVVRVQKLVRVLDSGTSVDMLPAGLDISRAKLGRRELYGRVSIKVGASFSEMALVLSRGDRWSGIEDVRRLVFRTRHSTGDAVGRSRQARQGYSPTIKLP